MIKCSSDKQCDNKLKFCISCKEDFYQKFLLFRMYRFFHSGDLVLHSARKSHPIAREGRIFKVRKKSINQNQNHIILRMNFFTALRQNIEHELCLFAFVIPRNQFKQTTFVSCLKKIQRIIWKLLERIKLVHFQIVFSFFFAGAVLCLGLSFAFHTLSCHSINIGRLFCK